MVFISGWLHLKGAPAGPSMPAMNQLLRPLIAGCTALGLCAFTLSFAAYGQEVYRCGSSYSDAPCAGGKAVSTEPLVEVHPSAAQPRRTNTQGPRNAYQQQRHEERAWDRMERELDKAQAESPPQRSTTNRRQCEAKQQRIQKIDELARKGGSVQQMERLREERQKARDWQFRAGC